MEQLKVFLDTNILLKGFVTYRNNVSVLDEYMRDETVQLDSETILTAVSNKNLLSCLTDKTAQRYTFEKCIFESYMAFRGIGGKKPDEGRGDWAQRFLRNDSDPKSVGDLSSVFHGGWSEGSFYWINQILELYGNDSLQRQRQLVNQYTDESKREKALERIEQLERLIEERSKFEALCWDFDRFIRKMRIQVVPYGTVFDAQESDDTMYHLTQLDSFVRETALPSEDFEIVYAAMRLRADIFVTDDKRLIKCSHSLGLNYPLSAFNFCESSEYLQRASKIRELRGDPLDDPN